MRPLQKQIIDYEKVKPQIDPEAEIKRSVNFLQDFLLQNHLQTLVLGISGGQDSTLAGRLCQLAVEQLRRKTGQQQYQFVAVRLPYGKQADESDALAALSWMKPDQVMRVDIKPAVDATVASIENNKLEISDFNKGNIKARQRMIVQYAIAGDLKGCVVGTDHAAENVTGFYTKYGDGAADLTPLFRLNKRQGRQLLAALGAPAPLYTKVPTADLEDQRPGLADEAALGVSYEDIDNYLEGQEISAQAAQQIETWYQKTAHKRRLPYTVFDHLKKENS
ncbi:ammonia-dependent NAD(+) synthetase [Lactobacillus sp. W8089]|nr:ammonia-dependent NAD(+) synthetase [Lactobacillus sp. W8086]MBI0109041.1 ammonia-dependent NAD(+) synthetase [Lactobacillus sp. W8085]MBI0112257.1 ammonia-dependent NAD(+) synthetase [Lactobacillus sp. W8088]MBI0115973.1 ammonia-dependent NAD(+) synthetase [Lactobacillus sp. W8087]MBI0119698.1 ammonia-dependent NAD(+) synthetase [Lactobacillus sp. W8089]MBI0131663.1 ammonia-dependent NAD(+) synthetase [Lactobacillus sp. W8090]